MNIDIIEIVRTCIAFEEETLWMSKQHGAQEAWDNCPYGDWMLWMLSLTAGEGNTEVHRNIVLAACDCARMAVGLVKVSPAIVDALSEVEMWAEDCTSNITIEPLRNNIGTVISKYSVAASDSGRYMAARAVGYALLSVKNYCYAWCAIVDAVRAYYEVNTSYVAPDVRLRGREVCADIVRKRFPYPPVIRGTVGVK